MLSLKFLPIAEDADVARTSAILQNSSTVWNFFKHKCKKCEVWFPWQNAKKCHHPQLSTVDTHYLQHKFTSQSLTCHAEYEFIWSLLLASNTFRPRMPDTLWSVCITWHTVTFKADSFAYLVLLSSGRDPQPCLDVWNLTPYFTTLLSDVQILLNCAKLSAPPCSQCRITMHPQLYRGKSFILPWYDIWQVESMNSLGIWAIMGGITSEIWRHFIRVNSCLYHSLLLAALSIRGHTATSHM